MLSKTSVDEVFMHHFEKMSSAYGGFAPTLPPGAALDPSGGLPFFRPPHYPPLEKNRLSDPLITHPWKKSCRRPCSTVGLVCW